MQAANYSAPIPHLAVNDGEAAVKYYEKAFGAVTKAKMPADDGKRLMHAHLQLGAGEIFLHDEFPEYTDHVGAIAPARLGGASCTLHINVPDADAAFEQAVKAGATSLMPPANQFWGMRYGELKDPFGHIWGIGGPVK
jgi:PhnB protein